jgi:hypothetical protein
MVVTGSQIAISALTILGINEQGGTPSASDQADAITELNNLWDAWSIDEGLIWEEIVARFPISANVASYTIGLSQNNGPAGKFNIQAPARVYKARLTSANNGAISANALSAGGTGYVANDTGVVLGANGTQATYTVNTVGAGGAVATYTLNTNGTGYIAAAGVATATGGGQPGAGIGFRIDINSVTAGGETRTELDIVSAKRYYAHRDLQASAQTPDELYPDYNPDENGLERLSFYPIPSAAGTLELEMGVIFATWLATTSVGLPPAAVDAINYALAWRLIPRYGMAVAKEIVEVVQEIASKAEARFRDAVAKTRQIPAPAVQPATTQPSPAGGA